MLPLVCLASYTFLLSKSTHRWDKTYNIQTCGQLLSVLAGSGCHFFWDAPPLSAPPKHLRHLEQRYLGFSDPRRRNPNSPSFGPQTCSDRPQLGPSGDIFFFILNQASVMRSLPALVCACCLFLCETKPSTYFVTHFILTQ